MGAYALTKGIDCCTALATNVGLIAGVVRSANATLATQNLTICPSCPKGEKVFIFFRCTYVTFE